MESGTKIDIRYADHNIIFDITDSTDNKNYSLCRLNRENLKELLRKLKDIRNLTWKQFSAKSRDTGITSERKGTESFNMIDAQNSSPNKIVEKYYFHFRIGAQHSTFRIFGYQYKNAFCITHFDIKGDIHDH